MTPSKLESGYCSFLIQTDVFKPQISSHPPGMPFLPPPPSTSSNLDVSCPYPPMPARSPGCLLVTLPSCTMPATQTAPLALECHSRGQDYAPGVVAGVCMVNKTFNISVPQACPTLKQKREGSPVFVKQSLSQGVTVPLVFTTLLGL